jgi:hypothetical protein
MKKILLSTFAVASLVASAQTNPKGLKETMSIESSSPCFLGYATGPGSFQYSPGHDFTSLSHDPTQGEGGALIMTGKTHADEHGPLYYQLSKGDDVECEPKKGLVDITDAPEVSLRIKASSAVQIVVFVQEGNGASWNYTKFSATSGTFDVTTEWQVFEISSISASSNDPASADIDLTQIGIVAFELGKTDGTSFDTFDGTVSVDYIKLGAAVKALSTETPIASGLNIFPNPATDVLNVNFDATSATTIDLVDITGKVVDSKLTQAGFATTSFNTAEINSGVYFVNIKNAVGSTTNKVVVK